MYYIVHFDSADAMVLLKSVCLAVLNSKLPFSGVF